MNSKLENRKFKNWSKALQLIEIESSIDNQTQNAFFYSTKSSKPQPLIVSLHTWGGNFAQKDKLIEQIIDKDWNYIHPDFRGPNRSFKACGSKFVISDIEDAIDYSIKHGNVDTNNIHIMGVSGGGYATLVMIMKSKHEIKSFSTWVLISNLLDWYYESKGRENRYAKDILLCTGSDNDDGLNIKEAKRRFPFFMDTPIEKRKESKLFIYTGIHDGYKGSVPITHSINFYDKLVKDINPVAVDSIIPPQVILDLVVKRTYTGVIPDEKVGSRKVIFKKQFKNINLIIFEGRHEMIYEGVLDFIDEIE